MTVRELITFLETLGDKAGSCTVVIEGTDHSFRRVSSISHEPAEQTKGKDLYAFFTDDNMAHDSKKVNVVVIS